MEFSWAYALLNAISAFVGAGLSFRGLAMPRIAVLRVEKEFLKKEIVILRKDILLLKEDYANFKAEVKQDFSELAHNDSNISKRMDLLEFRINENTDLLKSIERHFRQTIELLSGKITNNE